MSLISEVRTRSVCSLRLILGNKDIKSTGRDDHEPVTGVVALRTHESHHAAETRGEINALGWLHVSKGPATDRILQSVKQRETLAVVDPARVQPTDHRVVGSGDDRDLGVLDAFAVDVVAILQFVKGREPSLDFSSDFDLPDSEFRKPLFGRRGVFSRRDGNNHKLQGFELRVVVG